MDKKFKPEEHCQFCGGNPDEREVMIEATGGIRICSRCVEMSRDIVGHERMKRGENRVIKMPPVY